jgi:hypothetical protein
MFAYVAVGRGRFRFTLHPPIKKCRGCREIAGALFFSTLSLFWAGNEKKSFVTMQKMTSAVDWRAPDVAFALTRDGAAFQKENSCHHDKEDSCDGNMPFARASREWRLQQLCCIIGRGPKTLDAVENSLVDSLEYLTKRILELEQCDPEGLLNGHGQTYKGHLQLFGNLLRNMDRMLKRGFIMLVNPRMYIT